jgi:hypothetical protein
VIGISNEPISTITKFIEDQGITFPVLHDVSGIYSDYNIPGRQSPYPRDFIIDKNGVIQFAKTEYDPGSMISIIESLLDTSLVSVSQSVTIPKNFELYQNYPNPFNPNTTIRFNVSTPQEIHLDIIDLNGKIINTLIRSRKIEAGVHEIQWNGKNKNGKEIPSGIYFSRLANNSNIITKKMILLH